jgi:hypothetical protein
MTDTKTPSYDQVPEELPLPYTYVLRFPLRAGDNIRLTELVFKRPMTAGDILDISIFELQSIKTEPMLRILGKMCGQPFELLKMMAPTDVVGLTKVFELFFTDSREIPTE